MRQSVLSMFCAAYGKNDWDNLLDSRLRSLQEMYFVIKHDVSFVLKWLLRLVALCQAKSSSGLFLGMFRDSDECFRYLYAFLGEEAVSVKRLIPKLSPKDMRDHVAGHYFSSRFCRLVLHCNLAYGMFS